VKKKALAIIELIRLIFGFRVSCLDCRQHRKIPPIPGILQTGYSVALTPYPVLHPVLYPDVNGQNWTKMDEKA
jgi:hypothetical protein